MSEYRRPTIPVEICRDEHGRQIEYGSRVARAVPTGDVDPSSINRKRFAPLHDVALAPIDWLQNTFDVTVEHTPTAATDLLRMEDDGVRAIRVVPREPTAAPLTFVFTRFPSVDLHAGVLHDFHFLERGDDAWDDDVLDEADDLEWVVRTVVAGGYSDALARGPFG